MMKKLTFFFLLITGFAFSQMPNISEVWLNNSKAYLGNIGSPPTTLKFKVNLSERNKKNDQQYFLSGTSVVENQVSKFEGKLTITKYKDGKKRSSMYGEYEFAEEPTGQHSGIFKGKFVYTFMWNKKTEKIERQYMSFIGDWKGYDGKLNYKTIWSN